MLCYVMLCYNTNMSFHLLKLFTACMCMLSPNKFNWIETAVIPLTLYRIEQPCELRSNIIKTCVILTKKTLKNIELCIHLPSKTYE